MLPDAARRRRVACCCRAPTSAARSSPTDCASAGADGHRGRRLPHRARRRRSRTAGPTSTGCCSTADIDMVTFTSASAVRNFSEVYGAEQAADLLKNTVVAAIGPVTAEAADAARHRRHRRADRPTPSRRWSTPSPRTWPARGVEHLAPFAVRSGFSRTSWQDPPMAVTTLTSLSLTRRPRRLRRTEAIRALVRETRLTPDCFIYPLFVCEGEGVRREIGSMPGVFQLSVDEAVKEAAAAKARRRAGGAAVRPARQQGRRSARPASDPEAPVQAAVRALKREVPRPARDDRRLPVRVHVARPLRHRRRRRDRQRRHRRAAGARPRCRTPWPAPTSSRRRT